MALFATAWRWRICRHLQELFKSAMMVKITGTRNPPGRAGLRQICYCCAPHKAMKRGFLLSPASKDRLPEPRRRKAALGGAAPVYACRKSSLTVLLGAVFALGLATACGKEPAAPATEVEVEAATAEVEPMTMHISADAILAPVDEAAIASKITAPIAKFYVQRGSKVRGGELLATLENHDLSAAAKENRGNLAAAQAAYQTAVKTQVPQDYQRAELDLEQAKANLDLNQQIVKSRQQLFAQGAIPGRDLDTAQAALVAAQSAYDAAAKHLSDMQQVGRKAALDSAKGQLESAEGRYQAAEAELSYSEIRSPIDGVVTDRPLFAGETATAGTPVITVMDTRALLAKMHLPQPQAQLLRNGGSAEAVIPGAAGPVPGKIVLISPALDPGSTTVEVWVRIENPTGRLRPGTPVHVVMAGNSVEKALAVPSQSIVTASSGQKAVMVIDGAGVAHQTAVTTGIEDGGKTQILGGLSPGQRVVTEGAYALDDGTHVRVVSSLQRADTDAGGDEK